ncbi:MAG: DUF4157 domain-containing protein, partial [Kamptonema sp. SIO4C4]|nr:DUF4157 domain-containing protein [Kamptonema sp. SIO4C4]
MPHYIRQSNRKSSVNSIQAKFSPPPIRPPETENKADEPVSAVKPRITDAVSPLQRLLDSQAVQAKLTIGEPNDKYEQEADVVAKDVVQRINAPVSEKAQQETVQRETIEEEEDQLQMKPIVQRVSAVDGGEASTELESSINRAKGGGQSLDGGLQRSMGQAMGADFSGVRVHTDSHADQLNQSIQAKAFTTGQDVFFKKGEYQPGSKGGQELIAHELTHVVQQTGNNGLRRHVIQRSIDEL